MPENRLTYEILQHEVKVQVIPYTLLRGQGGPLLLLWSVGIAVFLLSNLWVYALPLTGAMLAFGFGAMRGYLKDRQVQEILFRSIIEKRYPRQKLTDAGLQSSVQRGIDIFVEIALKITEIEKVPGKNLSLRRVLTDADGMLSLQYESAKQAEEFDRGLRLIGSGYGVGTDLKPTRPEATEAGRLREQNITVIRKEAGQARSLARDIVQQLETLMLQIFQLEQRASDIVRTEEFARETEETLGKIQAEVNARREAAQSVIETLMPR